MHTSYDSVDNQRALGNYTVSCRFQSSLQDEWNKIENEWMQWDETTRFSSYTIEIHELLQ